MKIKEIRQKSEKDLHKLLKLNREQMRDMRFRIASKQYKAVRDLREIKKDIAKILTVLKEKKVLKELTNQKKEN